MHIVHCLSRSILGGGPSLVYSLVRGISARYPKVRQSVLLPAGGVFVERFRSLGVEVHEIPFDRLAPDTFFAARKILSALNPTLVHSHGRGAGLYARMTSITGVAHVHSYHGLHHPRSRIVQLALRQLEMTLLRRTNLVVSISKGEAEDLSAEYSFSPEKTAVIENELDSAALEQAARKRLSKHEQAFFRKHRNPFITIMVARDDPVKNYPLAVEVARSVLTQSRKTLFVFVGGGARTSELARLQSEFPHRVLNVGELSNPSPLLRKADCLMMTSRKEGRSLTVLEAQYLGKPVIATNVPGLRDMVRSGIDGVLCAEDASSLSAVILRLSERPKEWVQLKNNAAKHAPRGSFNAWIDQYMKHYRMLSHGLDGR